MGRQAGEPGLRTAQRSLGGAHWEGRGVPQDDAEAAEGRERVICTCEPRDTMVLPCRHMCLCAECAQALRLQTNKCPL